MDALATVLKGCSEEALAPVLAELTLELDAGTVAADQYTQAYWGKSLKWPKLTMSKANADGAAAPSSGGVAVVVAVPVADYFTKLYLKTRRFEFREALLHLLAAGADPNLATPWTAAEPPPFLQVLHAVPFDIFLARAFVAAGASLRPFAVHHRPHGAGRPDEGISFLHVLHQSLEHVHLIKRFFVVADAGKRLMRRAAENDEKEVTDEASSLPLSEVFRELATLRATTRMKDWQVCCPGVANVMCV